MSALVTDHPPTRGAYERLGDETTALNQNLVERIGGEDHVRFLAEASEILTGSLDYETEQSARHAVRVEAPGTPVCGAWDRVRLGQVVENLLGNALKHGAEDGEVVVSVEQRAGEALISVQDFGPGIHPDHMPHLFDRFYRANTRSSGLGLGLYISRILVEAHGGRVCTESLPGQGSTFTVALPLHS